MFRNIVVAGALGFGFVASAPALALDSLKILVPANPGGGWDQTGRELQAAINAEGIVRKVPVDNKGGAGGTIGLAQLINNSKGDDYALMTSGKGMVSAVFINKSPVTLSNATPIARLTGEYEVLVVPASSPLKTMADLVAAYKANPGAVSWAGGFAGGVDQLTAGMIVQAIGGEAGKFNYVAFGSGGEVLAQVLGGHVTVGLGGYNEFAGQIKVGKLRALAVTAPARVKDIDVATLKEQGIDVEFVNWRGLMAAPGLPEAQRQELIKVVTQMAKSEQWKATLEKNEWVDMLMTGDEFRNYVEAEQKTVFKLVNDLGLVKK